MKQIYKVGEDNLDAILGEWLKKQGLKSGDSITIEETDNGLLISPRVTRLVKALETIGNELKKQSVTFEDLMDDSEVVREAIYQERYSKKSS